LNKSDDLLQVANVSTNNTAYYDFVSNKNGRKTRSPYKVITRFFLPISALYKVTFYRTIRDFKLKQQTTEQTTLIITL